MMANMRFFASFALPSAPRDRDREHHEEDRRYEAELSAEQVAFALDPRAAHRAEPVRELEAERRPVVLRVPLEHGDHHDRGEQHRDVRPGSSELAAQRRNDRERNDECRRQQHPGVLGAHRRAARESGERPPAERAARRGIIADRAFDAEERERAEAEERRIGRREHEPRAGEWQAGEDDRGAQRRSMARDPVGDRDHREHREEPEQHGHHADPERRIAEDERSLRDRGRDPRRMIEVTAREPARPFPVVGLVGEGRDATRPARSARSPHRSRSRRPCRAPSAERRDPPSCPSPAHDSHNEKDHP